MTPRSVLSRCVTASTLLVSLLASPSAEAASPFTLFESGQVRPLALAPNGKWLFAVTPRDWQYTVWQSSPMRSTAR